MSQQARIDLSQVRRFASQLQQAATELHENRADLLARLANGDGIHPSVKTKDNVKVTIGANATDERPGAQAGELIASKIKSCGDAFTTVEDGLRALSSVMSKMADGLQGDDDLTAAELNAAVQDLYCVVLVSGDDSSDPVDWFGLGQNA